MPLALTCGKRNVLVPRGQRGFLAGRDAVYANRMPRRPALVRRLPPLFRNPSSDPILKPEVRTAFPELEDEFRFLDEHLVPRFTELDEAALAGQRSFRLQQLALIAGGAASATLGGLRASVGWTWAALAEAVVAGLLVVVVLVTQRSSAQRRYLSTRLHAEKLRGEYFRFVVRTGDYADETERRGALKRRVAELTKDVEP